MLIPPNNDFLDNLGAQQDEKMLREVVTMLNTTSKQNKLHEEIRNDDDYDDWEYGRTDHRGKCLNRCKLRFKNALDR